MNECDKPGIVEVLGSHIEYTFLFAIFQPCGQCLR